MAAARRGRETNSRYKAQAAGEAAARAASRAGPLLCTRVGVDSDRRNGPKRVLLCSPGPWWGANRSSDWFTPAVQFEVLKGG